MRSPSHVHLAGPGPESTPVSSPATAVLLPDPLSGRLADLLAGARSPGQPYELRYESGFRASYILVALTWSSVRRRSARTLLTVTLSSVRSLLPSTTPQPSECGAHGRHHHSPDPANGSLTGDATGVSTPTVTVTNKCLNNQLQ